MDAFQITPFDGEVARHFGTDGDTDGIERRDDLFGRDFASDHRVDFKDDPFLFHQPDAYMYDGRTGSSEHASLSHHTHLNNAR